MQWQDYLSEALVALLLALLNAALGYLTAYLRRRYTAEQLRQAMDIASIVVGAVEQIFRQQGVDGSAKLEEAEQLVQPLAEHVGIHLTEDQWRVLIERAVHEMNKAKAALTTNEQQ